jgi:exoribonuclease R
VARSKRGAIDFETIETMMLFNDQGKIEKIVPVHRNDAHRVIEECMLAANVCASDFLQSQAAALPVPDSRRPDSGETRSVCATFSRSSASGSVVVRSDGQGLRRVAGENQDPSRMPSCCRR